MRLKEKHDRCQEEVNAYKIEKKKLESTLMEKEVAMKAMKRSSLHLGWIVNHIHKQRSFLNEKKLLSQPLQKTTSRALIMYKLLKYFTVALRVRY